MIYICGVEKLEVDNFPSWECQIRLILGIMDKDHSMRDDAPVVLVAEGDNDPTLFERTAASEEE